ncbi:methyltransferase family protein [Saccharothrix longispora]|uniref:Protein-S-isoprenylcysteine O-methyltransferase Ste14 n=1 Tax=Saccharothrix longispora TaxID=33920 RepID=A0ABU1PME8_9PSEU|nr:isoprenylcysteine carboxylmethyltransferase family protein [Saccharothrix longispora]MDR6591837.1 protein-S-isoprenylcysteine O-methyltransferase Ste14 [Saccharothrix longispora]
MGTGEPPDAPHPTPPGPAPAGPPQPGAARDRTVAVSLVAAQFALLVILAVPQPRWASPPPLRWTGLVLVALGLVVMAATAATLRRGLTPSPLPNDHAVLRTTGPYRFVRHPMYTGLLITALGWTLASPGPVRACALLALAVLLGVKARWEETRLVRRFPDYPAYARRVPRLVPGFRPRATRDR